MSATRCSPFNNAERGYEIPTGILLPPSLRNVQNPIGLCLPTSWENEKQVSGTAAHITCINYLKAHIDSWIEKFRSPNLNSQTPCHSVGACLQMSRLFFLFLLSSLRLKRNGKQRSHHFWTFFFFCKHKENCSHFLCWWVCPRWVEGGIALTGSRVRQSTAIGTRPVKSSKTINRSLLRHQAVASPFYRRKEKNKTKITRSKLRKRKKNLSPGHANTKASVEFSSCVMQF